MSINLIESNSRGTMPEKLPAGSVSSQSWSECELYGDAPGYESAHVRLGGAQQMGIDLAAAQQSFHQATEQDPQLVDGYVQTAALAVQQKHWKDLADSTEHIMELSPDSTPNFWFLNSAANFNLGNVAQAETSATRGLRLDPDHRVPQLEYLYGMILARRGDYKSVVEHMRTYLRLSPHASDAADAQNKLAQLQNSPPQKTWPPANRTSGTTTRAA